MTNPNSIGDGYYGTGAGSRSNGWSNLGRDAGNFGRSDDGRDQLSGERGDIRSLCEDQIIAALGWPEDGHPDTGYLGWSSGVILPQGSRERVVDEIRQGKILDWQADWITSQVRGPLDEPNGAESIFFQIKGQSVNGEQPNQRAVALRELRAIGYITCDRDGFNNAEKNVNKESILELYNKCKTPQSFFQEAEPFLDDVEENNGEAGIQKRATYLVAIKNLARMMYGKKYDYYLAFEKLKREAAYQRERSLEQLPENVGYCQTSRGQANDAIVNRENLDTGLPPDERCEDSACALPEQGFYGVFDGAGGEKNGGVASRMAAEMAYDSVKYKEDIQDAQGMAGLLNRINECVYNDKLAGYSTAVIAKVVDKGSGGKALLYASVGDSRLYVYRPTEGVYEMLNDESVEGRALTNCLGTFVEGAGYNITKQYGEMPLYPGDQIVLCTDGVTGDDESEAMSAGNVGYYLQNSTNPKDAAKNLVINARKIDDRTAIVVAV